MLKKKCKVNVQKNGVAIPMHLTKGADLGNMEPLPNI